MNISLFLKRFFLTSICLFSSTVLVGCGHTRSTSDTPNKTSVTPISANQHVVQLSSDAQNEANLELSEVKRKLLDISVKVTGEVLANANLMTHVTTPVTGRVTEVLVKIGDHINEGSPLLHIRSTDIQQAEADLLQNESQVRADLKQNLLQIDSDIATTEAQIKLSESTYNRIKNLVEEKIASMADFESAKTQFQKDQIILNALKRKRAATISLSQEHMKLMTEPIKTKLRLLGVSDTEITNVLNRHEVNPIVPLLSPESGIISDRLVNVGELVDPTKPLFTIGEFHNVWLKADIYEKDVSRIHEGQPIELEVDSFPGEVFRGKLDYVADSINPDTRTLAVRAEVPNPGLKLKPKMFARMKIIVGEHNVLCIPKEALQDAGNDNKVVYVPLGGGQFEERKVKTGSESEGSVEVLQGLSPGENVVTQGSFELRAQVLHNAS